MIPYFKISDVCEIIMGQSPPSDSYNDSQNGLPFFQGKADFGEINPTIRIYCDKPIKIAENGDILLSVRAPVGDVNIADCKCCIGRGLAAIRSKDNKVNSKYLYYVLKKNKSKIENLGTGSTFKAINKKQISDFLIPVPHIDEQLKIIHVLNMARNLINKRKAQIEALDQLTQSVFLEMFGDPVLNNMNWNTQKLSETGQLKRGLSKHRPRNAPELLGGAYPLVQTGDISKSGIFIKQYTQTYSELGLKQSKLWPAGTLCITIAANIAETGILTFDACFPDSIVAYLPNSYMSNIYVHTWFSFLQRIIEANAPESAQKNINLKILSELEIPVPPFEKQKKFENFILNLENKRKLFEFSLFELENSFNSLMQRAFKGELFTEKEEVSAL